jgi:hypothetical protein
MKRMARMTCVGLVVVCALLSHGRPQAAGCDPLGKVQFICDVISPEDFALVPGSAWMLTSGNRAGQGAIRALHLQDKKVVNVFPSATLKTAHDAKAFPTCPGPLNLADPAEKKTIQIHGLYLHASGSRIRLIAVHHGARESIEAFDVDAKASPPALTWVGCVVAPPNAVFNSTVVLPDGGIAATNTAGRVLGQKSTEKEPIGAVFEWHAASGWRAVPGTEGNRINGLEISKDGKYFYVAGWGEETMLRVERGGANPKRDVLKMPFRIDNLRMQADGTLLAGGHGGTALCSCPTETWHIGRIDPRGAMSVTELLREPYVPGFGASTVAMHVGKVIWIGTNRGDRIGYFPAP